jgi:hypothetical protein
MSGVGVGFGFTPEEGLFCRCLCCAKAVASDEAPSAIKIIAIEIEIRFKGILLRVFMQPPATHFIEFGLDRLIRD